MRMGGAWLLVCALMARAQDQGAIEQAKLLEQSGKADDAIALLQSFLQREPNSAEAHNWLGVAYLQKNSLGDAEAEFRQALKLHPGYIRAYNNLGSTLAQAGDLTGGIRFLQEGLKRSPDDFQLRLNLGMALRSKGDAEGALQHFRQLMRENGDNSDLQYQYGQTLRQNGDLPGAIAAFEKALDLNPESQPASYSLGQSLRQVGARAKRGLSPERLKAGNDALSRGDFAGARSAAEKAVTAEPDSPEAHYMLGFALWYAGDRASAAKELDESLRLLPSAADVCGFRGVTYRETGDLESARHMLLRAIALDPQRPLPYIDLAVVFLREGKLDRALGQFEAGMNLSAAQRGLPDLDTAIRELRQAIGNGAKEPGPYRVLGRLLGLAAADPAQVIAALEQAIRLRPDDPETHNSLGLVYVQTGDDEKAVAEFRKAIEFQPAYADAHQNLGAVLTTSDTAEAVRELEIAVKLQPQLAKAQYNLALAYEASPKHGPSRAIEQLRRLISLQPDYPRASFMLGRFLLREGQVGEAVEHLRRSVEQDPESGEARYQLGLALSRAGRREEGSTEITKGRGLIAASENRQAAGLDLVAAKSALEKGDVQTAAAKARKVLQFHPGSAEAQAILNAALPKSPSNASGASIEAKIREGRFEEAEQALRRYLAEQPRSAWAWYALGYSLYGQRKIGDSIKALAQSLRLDGTNADAHKVLGRNLMIIGRFDAAQIEFREGKRLNPKSAEMPYNLGKLYSIQDNWPEARSEFEAAVRLDPSYMEAYDGLGFALEALGDDAGAAMNYNKAIALSESRNAGFASPYVNLSALANRTGDRDAALDYARRALAVNPKSDRALFQMGKAHEYKGDLNASAEALAQAIELNPRSSSYYYVLAGVYRKLQKAEESRKAMEMFAKLDRESNELERKRRDFLREQ